MSPFPSSAPSTEEWRHLRLTRDDGVVTVTFARPEKLNALTFGAYA
ncbi:enoyl-CoA hydratase, partial [Streptomyces sp. SID7499]|nr:enoyl-CoA hydratase [Streptomyces sp. SID7499]